VAEPDEFALYPPVPPRGVVCRDAEYERADRGCRGWQSGTPATRVVPLARDQPPMLGEQRRRGHCKHLIPPAARNQPWQCREPQPVARLVADPADLAAQDRVLVPEHQELGVLGYLTPGQPGSPPRQDPVIEPHRLLCLLQPPDRITRRRECAWRQPDVTGERVTTLAAGKCVAPCRRAVLQWARRGKIYPLYQEGGSRCSLIVRRFQGLLSSKPGDALRAPSGIWRQPILRASSI
jgi:hypothetical protein